MTPQSFTKAEIRSIKICPHPECNSRNLTKFFIGKKKKIDEIRVECNHGHRYEMHVYDFDKLGRGIYQSILTVKTKKITSKGLDKCFVLFDKIKKITGFDFCIEQGFVRSPNGISFHLDEKYRWQMVGDNDIVPFIKQ